MALAQDGLVITLEIPLAVPSLNKTLWSHWTVKAKARKQWAWLVRAARNKAQAQPEGLAKSKVTIDRYSYRKLDHDNFVGGAKILMDSLVSEGFILDDSPDHVEVIYRQLQGKPRTVVTIGGQDEEKA